MTTGAKFTTEDLLNSEQEPEPTKDEILAEAMRIVRGETMMLATEKHLVALAELNAEMLAVLKGVNALFSNEPLFGIEKLGGSPITNADQSRIDQVFIAVDAAIARGEGRK